MILKKEKKRREKKKEKRKRKKIKEKGKKEKRKEKFITTSLHGWNLPPECMHILRHVPMRMPRDAVWCVYSAMQCRVGRVWRVPCTHTYSISRDKCGACIDSGLVGDPDAVDVRLLDTRTVRYAASWGPLRLHFSYYRRYSTPVLIYERFPAPCTLHCTTSRCYLPIAIRSLDSAL